MHGTDDQINSIKTNR